ncbi:hypothetical protein IJG12_00160 [Candidatus Saccharibacteria bacterium]|nr:hypothetical protein [Candidatus Saccharibacteria bacterium]
MINIVNCVIRFNDKREITGIELKLKAIPEEKENEEKHHLVARASAAFYATTLFGDTGKSLRTTLNPRRNDVVDLRVSLKENELSLSDVARFVEAYQRELDEAPF